MEDYEKKYKEALGWMQSLYNGLHGKTKEEAEHFFPELKESEDERIKKEIIAYLDVQDAISNRKDGDFKCWIAWLEKQDEQKPNDEDTIQSYSFYSYKGEPDFKVGDWIINPKTGNILQIKNVLLCGNKGNYEFGNNSMPIESVDRYYKRWTIQDAKDGDVLYCKNNGIEYIVMNKGINESGNIDSYFRYNSFSGFDIDVPSVLSAACDNITPATKEQCDTLFAKMHEASYEWDKEKKELKKIEQKMINEHDEHEPTSYEVEKWNEAYEKGYETGYMNGKIEQKPAGWSKQQVVNVLTKWLTEEIASIRKKSLDGTFTERYEMFEAALLEMRSFVNSSDFQIGKDTSVEWSEEDEKIIETMCKEGNLKPSEVQWLKSLKDRVQPKQQQSDNCDTYDNDND